MGRSVAIRRGARRPSFAHAIGLLALTIAASSCLDARGGETGPADAANPDPSKVEFFERSVRPLLATRCQSCHGASKQKGGLRLDSRAAVLAGGNTGPAVVPGDSRSSLLVQAVNYG